MKRIEKALLAGLVISFALIMCGFSGQRDDISEKILRMHVIANSDSEADQALKLLVRDRVLKEGASIFSGKNKEDAIKELSVRLPQLKSAAEEIVREQGYDYDVNVSIEPTHFNTRVYEQVTLPAGTYDAVNVRIGEAKGKNWWCVMFPPMCLSVAGEEEALSEVLNDTELDTVRGNQEFEIRFKALDLYERFIQWIKTPIHG